MKKKTFIVQILNSKKPSRTSFTQVEDANFYSNDTDASLVFIPHEDSFDFQSAKVVMFNRGDESLVERDMVVTTEDGHKVASYELPDEIISHWGEWVAQPVFINNDEIYSGAIVPFSVERHLMHERPPKLTEVVTVTKFVERSQELVNAMIQAEAQRITEEQVRQDSETNRVQAENERSVKYESYAQQFNDVIAELSEEKDYHSLPEIAGARGGHETLGVRLDKEHNETTAQLAQKVTHTELDAQLATLLDGGPSIFMDSLAMLNSTYPNGASGVALVRETDPAKIYIWDGSAWKDFGDYQGIAVKDETITKDKLSKDLQDKIIMSVKNDVSNGDFSEGTDTVASGFAPQDSTTNPRLVDGVQYWTGSTTAYAGSLRAYTFNLNSGDIYYISAITDNVAIVFANKLLINTFNVDGLHSATFVLDSDFSDITFRVRTINQESSVSQLQVINLTESFGVGNEPTKEFMDELISQHGYFDEYVFDEKWQVNKLLKLESSKDEKSEVENPESAGLYHSNDKGLIDFSYSDRTVYIPDGYFVYENMYVTPTNDVTEKTPYRYEVPFSSVTSAGLQALYFDKSSNKFVCKHYSEIANVPSRHYLVATFATSDNGTPPVSAMRVKVNGEVVGKNEEPEPKPETVSFDKNNQRFLLPPKMFFVEGDTLPLYKNSFFVGNTDINTNATKTALMTLNAKQEPTIEYFYENLTLDPRELNERFEIMMKGNRSNSEFYTSRIEKVSTSITEKEGRTPTILNIGDSLTRNSIPTFLKEKLEEYGVNPTMVGTCTDDGWTKGEGRAGWEFDNFIGKDNTNWSSVITPAPPIGYVGERDQNPFIKLATNSDKEKYPEWCFRNTGVSNELSYANDMDKTGDFYVFDFSHYLQTYGIDTPDIITIALSTNDIAQETSENAIANSRLSLEVMVKRIKEALPNVKIGVIPVSAYHINSSIWDTTIATWIEHAMNDMEAYSLEYSDLEIIPAWAHMNREFVFPATYSDLSPISNEQVGIVTDRTHYEAPGRREQAKVIAAYVMNVC